MDEAAAKTKWCPFARTRGFATEAAVNRPFLGVDGSVVQDECACIGPACAVWRWAVVPVASSPWHQKVEGDRLVTVHGVNAVAGYGYCGLAGAPQ